MSQVMPSPSASVAVYVPTAVVFSLTFWRPVPEITGAVLDRVVADVGADQAPVPSLLVARAVAEYRVPDLRPDKVVLVVPLPNELVEQTARAEGSWPPELAGDSPSSRAPEVQYCSWYPVMPAPLDGTVQEASRFLWPPLEGTLKVNLGVPGGPTSRMLTVTARLAEDAD